MDERIERVEETVQQIAPLLAGLGSDVQGAVLAELLSMYFAGHHPAIRDDIIETFMKTTKALIEPNENLMFLDRERPEGWSKQ